MFVSLCTTCGVYILWVCICVVPRVVGLSWGKVAVGLLDAESTWGVPLTLGMYFGIICQFRTGSFVLYFYIFFIIALT